MKRYLPVAMCLTVIFCYLSCSKRNSIQFIAPKSPKSQDEHRVERDYNQRKPTESYQNQYNAIIAANPEADMTTSVGVGDYRFVAINGYAPLLPGIIENDWSKIIYEQKNVKVISGTSDMIIEDWPNLQGAAHDYAVRYNKALNAFCRKKNLETCAKARTSTP